MHPILLCMAAGTVLGAGLAIATEPAAVPDARPSPSYVAQYQERFRAADSDGDGMLSKREAELAGLDHIVDSFARLDSDGDGRLTPAEIRRLLGKRVSS